MQCADDIDGGAVVTCSGPLTCRLMIMSSASGVGVSRVMSMTSGVVAFLAKRARLDCIKLD